MNNTFFGVSWALETQVATIKKPNNNCFNFIRLTCFVTINWTFKINVLDANATRWPYNEHRPTKLTIQTHYASELVTINKKLYGADYMRFRGVPKLDSRDDKFASTVGLVFRF